MWESYYSGSLLNFKRKKNGAKVIPDPIECQFLKTDNEKSNSMKTALWLILISYRLN